MSEYLVQETFEGCSIEQSSDDSSVAYIRNAKFLGMTSRNDREYTDSAVKNAVESGLYNGLPVYANHKLEGRDVRDVIGVTENSRFVSGQGVRGDVKYNPSDPQASKMAWLAENSPLTTGFSHHAGLKLKRQRGRKDIVEEITKTKSLDWVSDPATNTGFFESNDEEDKMSLENLDIATLKAEKPELFKELVESVKSDGNAEKELKELQDQVESLRKEKEAMEAERKLADLKEEVESELTESELGSEVPETIKSILWGLEDADDRKKLIADIVSCFPEEEKTEDEEKEDKVKGKRSTKRGSFDSTSLRNLLRSTKKGAK